MSDSTTEKRKAAANGGGTGWARRAVLGAACALVIGIYAWSAHSGFLESLGSGAQDSYYNLLVRGFRDGHLNVQREVPPGLAKLGNPLELNWTEGEMAGLNDLSYYKGKLYLYFGVTPALVLFWPYVALSGHYLAHKDAVLIFFSVGFLAGAGLLCAVWRRGFPETSFGALVAGTLALGLANFAPAMLGRGDVYEVAISCGYALTMLALAGVWAALRGGRRGFLWLAAASLAYGLALGARPSLLLGAVILLVPVAHAWRERRPVWKLLLAAGGPVVLLGLGILVYNAMRFDNPLEFGQRYQLAAGTHQQFRLRYLGFNFRVAFLAPAHWGGHFPFVRDIVAPAAPRSYSSVDYPYGVLTNMPVVWLALAAPLAWGRGRGEGRMRLRGLVAAVALLFGTAALILCLHDSMAVRYEFEFASPLVLLAVLGVFAVERALGGQPVWRRAARWGWGLLLAYSVAFNLLAGLHLQAQLQCGLGSALQEKGRVDEAITHYQKALQLEPDYPAAYDDLGTALQEKGRVDEAINQYQTALQSDPALSLAHIGLGKALLQKGKVDEAIGQFQTALQIKPDSADVHCNFGTALLQKGKVDEAISQFQTALQIKPDLTSAHNNLGNALMQKGRVDEAISHYQAALQIEPDYTESHNNLGNALTVKGDLEGAIAQYQKALAINPANEDAHFNLGNALVKSGKLDDALAQYRAAMELKPAEEGPLINLGAALLAKGDREEGIAQYRKALEIHPDNVEAHNNLGNALAAKGDLEEAIAHYRKALEIKPDYPEVRNNLGCALLQKGDFDQAMACFQTAYSLSPDPQTRWSSLGNDFLQKKDLKDAIACYRQALKINPRSTNDYANLGVALSRKGETQEALDSWRQALEINPDQIHVLNNLAWLLATTPDASLRDGAKAVALATQANQLGGGGDPLILRTLASACAEAGSFGMAAVTARRGLALAMEQKNDTLAATLQKEIKLYEADTPARYSITPDSGTAQPKEAPQKGEPTPPKPPP